MRDYYLGLSPFIADAGVSSSLLASIYLKASLAMSYRSYGPTNDRALELLTDTLTFVPKVDRLQYVDRLIYERVRERQTQNRAEAGIPWSAQHRPLPIPRIQDGMKTSMAHQNKLFSTPSCIGEGTDRMLQKQRQLERKALQETGLENQVQRRKQSNRRLPW